MVKRKGKAQGVVVRTTPQADKARDAAPKEGEEQEAPEMGTEAPAPGDADVAAAGATQGEVGDDAGVPQVSGGAKKKRKRQHPQARLSGAVASADAAFSPLDAPQGTSPADMAAVECASLPWLAPSGGSVRPVASQVLEWLLWPMKVETFFEEYWERKPLHLQRNKPDYYSGVFSKAVVDAALRGEHLGVEQGLAYGDLLNIARYEGGQKVLLNRGDRGQRAKPSEVDAAWRKGASLQAMHPQQYHTPVWALLSGLESAFGCLFGANAYLTPAGQQGFAPHFDDVEVFMLQMEGSKSWRLNAPPEGEEYPLPREYSRDFTPDELGDELLSCRLEQGDLLYLPRGTVHAGVADAEDGGGSFSNHLTVSTFQNHSWCHLMESAISSAIQRAASTNVEFRTGLPVDFFRYMGSWSSSHGEGPDFATKRADFGRRFRSLLKTLQDFVDLDEACDEFGVDFMARRLPPHLGSAGAGGSASGSSTSSMAAQAAAPVAEGSESKDADAPAEELSADSRVRWAEPGSLRAMMSTDPDTSEPTIMLFHCHGNTRGNHMNRAVEVEEDVGCLRFEAATFLPGMRALWKLGPSEFVRCGDLPIAEDDRLPFCQNLHDSGLLRVERASSSSAAAEGAAV